MIMKKKHFLYRSAYRKSQNVGLSKYQFDSILWASHEDHDSITQPTKQVQTEFSSQDKETKNEL